MKLKEEIKTPERCGPRHVAFNGNSNVVYVVGELDSTVLVYSVDKDSLKIKF